jgi:cytoskeletal protein RodZ
MSNNRNDFDFDDDFFEDDDQFEFGGDEEELTSGLGDEFDEDMPFIEEEPEERGGSRTFVVLAILMILLFIGGLALVLFLILRPAEVTPVQLTSTQVVLLNMTVEAQLAGTQTQAREFELLTLTAAAFTDTPSPTATDTPVTRPPTMTPTGTLDPTELAATQNALALAQTATAIALASQASPTPDLTLTAAAASPTPTIQVTSALEAVNQTATAIAGAFLTATAQAAVTAEVIPQTPGLTPGFTPVATALPDTGLFDTIATGGGEGIGLLAIAVVGLVGVIFLSRRVRTMNAKATAPNTPTDQVP